MIPEETKLAVEVYDPIEGFNRGTYRFNYYFDKYFFLPVVSGYQFIMPDYAEDRVSSFVDSVLIHVNLTGDSSKNNTASAETMIIVSLVSEPSLYFL